jgi:hypothetical protein
VKAETPRYPYFSTALPSLTNTASHAGLGFGKHSGRLQPKSSAKGMNQDNRRVHPSSFREAFLIILALPVCAATELLVQFLPAPNLNSPDNGAVCVSTNPAFSWSAVVGANRYWLTVAASAANLPTNPDAASCQACVASGISGFTNVTNYTPPTPFPNGGTTRPLQPNTTYYWRVQGFNTNGTQGSYSPIRSCASWWQSRLAIVGLDLQARRPLLATGPPQLRSCVQRKAANIFLALTHAPCQSSPSFNLSM